MTDKLPTIWDCKPHTRAKHAILKRYLDAWLPILSSQISKYQREHGSSQRQRILYIDGFAGPGIYKMGEPGSPVIAIRAARTHALEFPFPVEMLFIEQDDARYKKLLEVIEPEIKAAENSENIHAVAPCHGDCDSVLSSILDRYEFSGVKFGPALAFLDQFGYGAISMNLIERILEYPLCEVFSYLDYKDMNRWIGDPNKASAFDRAYGNESWRECIGLPERQMRSCLRDNYEAALKNEGGAKYVS